MAARGCHGHHRNAIEKVAPQAQNNVPIGLAKRRYGVIGRIS